MMTMIVEERAVTLLEKQWMFSMLLARLLDQARTLGYECTLGETWRPVETAQLYAKQGRGVAKSAHTARLAVDLNLFKEGVWLQKTEHHAALGEWWKAQHPECRWGGDFARADGNHYSITHEGVA